MSSRRHRQAFGVIQSEYQWQTHSHTHTHTNITIISHWKPLKSLAKCKCSSIFRFPDDISLFTNRQWRRVFFQTENGNLTICWLSDSSGYFRSRNSPKQTKIDTIRSNVDDDMLLEVPSSWTYSELGVSFACWRTAAPCLKRCTGRRPFRIASLSSATAFHLQRLKLWEENRNWLVCSRPTSKQLLTFRFGSVMSVSCNDFSAVFATPNSKWKFKRNGNFKTSKTSPRWALKLSRSSFMSKLRMKTAGAGDATMEMRSFIEMTSR